MENDKFTEAFLYLAKKQEDIPFEIMALLEEFVVCLYGSHLPQADIITINRARYELFHFHSKDFSDMPPTLDTLQFHTRWAAYTAGHIWRQALVKAPVLDSPMHWGYKHNGERLQPEWTTIPTISNKHLIVCKCKIGCKPPCKCSTKQVCSTSLCACRGQCYGQLRENEKL